MALDFARFPMNNGGPAANTPRSDRPKAQLWLNIGYPVEIKRTVDDAEVTETRFVSLPVGIPLDTQEPVEVTSSNEEFRQMQAARNYLLKQLQDAGMQLQPGEEQEVNLTIQLRRVNEAKPAPAVESNPFIIPMVAGGSK